MPQLRIATRSPLSPRSGSRPYAGHFQTEKGWKAEIVLEDGVLLYKRWGSESRLEPISSTSFKVPEKTVIMLEFEIDGDRIVGFTHKHPDRPGDHLQTSRSEAK